MKLVIIVIHLRKIMIYSLIILEMGKEYVGIVL